MALSTTLEKRLSYAVDSAITQDAPPASRVMLLNEYAVNMLTVHVLCDGTVRHCARETWFSAEREVRSTSCVLTVYAGVVLRDGAVNRVLGKHVFCDGAVSRVCVRNCAFLAVNYIE